MFTYVLYGLTTILLGISFAKDRKKTKQSLEKAWKAFESILPEILSILLLIGIMLAFLDAQTISKLFGKESGALGYLLAATVGSIVLLPGFVAFPLAASLLSAGAGYGQVTMFLTTLMMVGIVTLPLEGQYFGKKTALKRNGFALIYAVCISLVIEAVIG